MIKIGIIGATGYVGIELVRLLQQHSSAQLCHLVTESHIDKSIAKIYPHLKKFITEQGEAFNSAKICEDCDVVFIALPHGHATPIVEALLQAGKKVIDLSADFRLRKGDSYQQWYQQESPPSALLHQAVYGLSEIGYKNMIKNASLIANPGCYPTATLLAAMPAFNAGIVDFNDCIFDAKSGVSGAGRGLQLSNHFCEVTENLIPYKIAGCHRHTPEIEQELSVIAKKPVIIQFTPHLVPVIRGMLVTAYFKLTQACSSADIHRIYQDYYQTENFIRVYEMDEVPQMKNVRGTNYCDMGIQVDVRSGRLIVVSAIDNLIKGAAGQAIQNMNLMFDLPENTGLNMAAIYP